jgi:hypothetical protein
MNAPSTLQARTDTGHASATSAHAATQHTRLIAAAVALIAAVSVAPQARADSVSDFIAKWDPDHARRSTWRRSTKGADAAFDKLDCRS